MDSREALLAELRALRTRRGLTLGRLEESRTILSVLGETSIKSAHERLIVALDRLGHDIQAEALKNAYGLGPSNASTLAGRRDDFGQLHDGRHSDTVESWENKMLEELATFLLSGHEQVIGEYEQTVVIRMVDVRSMSLFVELFHAPERTDPEAYLDKRAEWYRDDAPREIGSTLVYQFEGLESGSPKALSFSIRFPFWNRPTTVTCQRAGTLRELFCLSRPEAIDVLEDDQDPTVAWATPKFVNPLPGELFLLRWD